MSPNLLPNPNPFPVEDPLTNDSFLNSLGLGKYDMVDMAELRQMKESTLKDLILPMGTRKKILQAIACLPKQ